MTQQRELVQRSSVQNQRNAPALQRSHLDPEHHRSEIRGARTDNHHRRTGCGYSYTPPRARKSKEESSSASALQRSELQHTQPAILALSYDIERRFCITAQLQPFSATALYVFTFFPLVRGAVGGKYCTLTGSLKTPRSGQVAF